MAKNKEVKIEEKVEEKVEVPVKVVKTEVEILHELLKELHERGFNSIGDVENRIAHLQK